MKRMVLGCIGAFALLMLAPEWSVAQSFADVPPEPSAMRLSPDLVEIVKMVHGSVPEEQILGQIKVFPRKYDLTPEDISNLKTLGVPNKYISAMRAHDKALARLWKRGATSFATTNSVSEELDPSRATSGKMRGGNPATDLGTPMRSDAPLILLRAPRASTNPPPAEFVRPWTSTIIVEQAPPPPKLEVTPEPPGPGYVWIPGNWMWRGGNWSWESGRWLRRPSPTSKWMDNDWRPHARGWIWVPGQWK